MVGFVSTPNGKLREKYRFSTLKHFGLKIWLIRLSKTDLNIPIATGMICRVQIYDNFYDTMCTFRAYL